MPVLIIRAIRSAERDPKRRVVERWPFEVPNLQTAQDIVDETDLGNEDIWLEADCVEIADFSGSILAARPYTKPDETRAVWVKKTAG